MTVVAIQRIPAIGWEDYAGHVERYTYAASKIHPGETVNDVACGVGYGAALLAPVAGAYCGYDRPGVPDDRFLEHGQVRLVGCDLNDPDWRPDEADVTVCHATLEHVEDPWQLAATLAATTRRALVVSVPTEPTKHLNPWHLHDFTADEIPPLFPGFDVTDRWAQPDELGHVWTLKRT
jgi:SAM-dependent methyltransferase